jgi:phage gp36-like protein
MAYATVAQFIEAFGQVEAVELSNLDDLEIVVVRDEILERALTDASAEMDSYFWRYTLPFISLPHPLIGCCLDIARHRLDRVREREDVRARYEDWRKWLELVAKGTIRLGVDATQTAVTPAADTEVWSTSADRQYTNDSLAGFY